MSFSRAVGPLEKLSIASGQRSPFVMNLILEGEGAVDREAAVRAVEAAGDANPGARLILRGGRWVDGGRPVPVGPLEGDLQVQRDVREGPLCEVLLGPGRVVLRVHHAIMDGTGMGYFAAEIFRALRGEPLLGSPSARMDLDVARELRVARDPAWRAAGLAPTGRAQGGSRALQWTRLSLPQRTRGAVGPVALAVARAARERREGPVHLHVVTDLRRKHAPPFSLANVTGILPLEVAPGDDLRSLKRKLISALRANRDAAFLPEAAAFQKMPLWLLRAVVGLRAWQSRRSGFYVPSAVISFLEVDEAMFSAPGFACKSVIGVPPLGESVPCFVGIVSTRQVTEVALAIPEALASDGRAEALQERIAQALRGENDSTAPDSR